MNRFAFLGSTALLTALAAVGADAQTASPIQAERLSQHIKILSSDAFEGRGPATPGETKAVAYISEQFKAVGLQPGGEDGGWTQKVPLARFQVQGPVKMTLTVNGKPQAFTQGDQAVVQTLLPVDHVAIANAPMVFVGYGVKAPERNWDDFKGVDLKGKIAVVLVNDPDFENPASTLFGGKAMTYYGRWMYKYEEAARQGALGMLIVHETGPASYGWNTVKNSNANAQFDIVRDDPKTAHPLMQGWIQRDVAVSLFKACGMDFEAAKAEAKTAAFTPKPLGCASFSADYPVEHSQIVTRNVVGRIPGSQRPDETVIYSAHWDHLGVGLPDARGDRIYNGAIDNGDGVAGLIEIARAFAAGPKPQRSVVFLSVTAEEKGLLGSLYYAMHPLYPTAKTVANLNMDALSAAGPAHDVTVSGGGQSDLEDMLDAVARTHGRHLSPDPNPGAGHYYRSDHFSFAKYGVPGISLGSGQDLLTGGPAAGKAWEDDYVARRYHQPADEWSPSLDLSGQVEDEGVLLELGEKLANSTAWPAWKPTSEFKPIRDTTAAERQ